jgi:hypothetical protein
MDHVQSLDHQKELIRMQEVEAESPLLPESVSPPSMVQTDNTEGTLIYNVTSLIYRIRFSFV